MSQVLSGGRVLSFNSALVSDTGRYTCVAVNAGGEQQREYDLRVYGETNPIGPFSTSVVVVPFQIQTCVTMYIYIHGFTCS